MRRRPLTPVLLLVLAILAAAPAVGAQQPEKVRRIGWLSPFPRSDFLLEAFLEELGALGWVEGQNFVLERRQVEEGGRSLPAVATELAGQEVDILVTGGTPNIRALKSATRTIPIVFGVAGDPVASGLVASLARPGGNVTGITLIADYTMVGKHLELLAEAARGPSRGAVVRVAVLANPENPTHVDKMKQLEAARRTLGVELERIDARNPDELAPAFTSMRRRGARALLVLADTVFFQTRRRIADLATKSRLPAMYFLREHVEAGGLMAYAPSLPETFRRAAHQVDKILRGARPAQLPVERPSRFDLVINLRAAKALGLTIPAALRLRANQLIQ